MLLVLCGLSLLLLTLLRWQQRQRVPLRQPLHGCGRYRHAGMPLLAGRDEPVPHSAHPAFAAIQVLPPPDGFAR